ncbi:MAG: hypothetical protein ACQCN6_01360 [Candidatus Bathyarchaeia archaeon]
MTFGRKNKIVFALGSTLASALILFSLSLSVAQTQTPFPTTLTPNVTSASPNASSNFTSPGDIGVPHDTAGPSPTIPELSLGIALLTIVAAATVSVVLAKYKKR